MFEEKHVEFVFFKWYQDKNTDPLDLPLTQLQFQMNVYRNPVGFGG